MDRQAPRSLNAGEPSRDPSEALSEDHADQQVGSIRVIILDLLPLSLKILRDLSSPSLRTRDLTILHNSATLHAGIVEDFMFGVHVWREIASAFAAASSITSRVYVETGHNNEEAQSEGEVLL